MKAIEDKIEEMVGISLFHTDRAFYLSMFLRHMDLVLEDVKRLRGEARELAFHSMKLELDELDSF